MLEKAQSKLRTLKVETIEQSLLRLRNVYALQQEFIQKRYNLRAEEFNIIFHLHGHKNQRMRDLGDRFNIKLSTLTSIVDKIEQGKYVRRENSTKDRRVVYLVLTPKGTRVCLSYLSYIEEISSRLKMDLHEQELTAFAEVTRQLENSLLLKND